MPQVPTGLLEGGITDTYRSQICLLIHPPYSLELTNISLHPFPQVPTGTLIVGSTERYGSDKTVYLATSADLIPTAATIPEARYNSAITC